MTTYSITYETADGSVEHFANETSKARAQKLARLCARCSTLNETETVTRWFVEADDQTVTAVVVARP